MPGKAVKTTLTEEEKIRLGLIAQTLGYSYGGQGSISQLLKAIAKGDIVISPKKT